MGTGSERQVPGSRLEPPEPTTGNRGPGTGGYLSQLFTEELVCQLWVCRICDLTGIVNPRIKMIETSGNNTIPSFMTGLVNDAKSNKKTTISKISEAVLKKLKSIPFGRKKMLVLYTA